MQGAVAAGHINTAEAAVSLLESGGNAFDAALAALCAASVVEPVLASLGGGGFLLARTANGDTRVYDFFVHTPKHKRPEEELDFQPITADFGTAQQEFHIGMGAIATPGMIRGLFDIHRQLGTLPMKEIMAPAIGYARQGIPVNQLQAYIFGIVKPIYIFSQETREVYSRNEEGTRLYGEGELFTQPELADTLELLSREGDRLFYEGEMGQQLVERCRSNGGHLRLDDLESFQTVIRQPLRHQYRNSRLYTNPPPSSGGLLIAFAQELLADHKVGGMGFGSPGHLGLLARVMEQTNLARKEQSMSGKLLEERLLARYRAAIGSHPQTARGTTHISVIDQAGNTAALSLSNGEGCGHVLAGTGIMPNNMLGEEDLNPGGFHRWPEDSRVSSMMAPTLVEDNQRLIATGSGGSNRLRTAILQTLSNLVDFGMDAQQAVNSPRIHNERGLISIEPGFSEEAVAALQGEWEAHHLWRERNLFFGGTHTVTFDGNVFDGAGDPRRGGVFLTI